MSELNQDFATGNSGAEFTYNLHTLGCKANLTDSQYLEMRLARLGGRPTDSIEEADVFVVNSCTVTDRADRDALALIRKQNSSGKVAVLTGCMAEVSPESVEDSAFAGFDRIILGRNSGKSELPEAIAKTTLANRLIRKGELPTNAIPRSVVITGKRAAWHNEMDLEPGAALVGGQSQRTRAFFKVQDGCDQFCTYCVIPHARGRSRSLAPQKVVDEINAFSDEGLKEVVLTAIHAADYDWEGMSFTGLVRYVLRNTRMPRIRLTSLDPSEINVELLEMMATESRLCPHFHVSMQSASTRVLEAMKRHYDSERAEECLWEIRKYIPHAFVGMDMIAGFPGESREDHEDTMALLRRSPWTRLHVFPYSTRKMTQAGRMVDGGLGVSDQEKKRRAAELRELSDLRHKAEHEQRLGSQVEVLTEAKPFLNAGKHFTQGRSRSYVRVILPEEMPANRLVAARLVSLGPRDTVIAERI